MNAKHWLAGVALGALALPALAGDDYSAWAKVVDVEPRYRTVRVSTPTRECYDEEVYVERPGYQSHTGTILGGIVGGVLGHEIGGHHRGPATAAGVVLGASLGRDMSHRRRADGYYVTEERCDIRRAYHEEERVDGYRVTYVYGGRTHVTYSDVDPGERIRVDVAVRPTYADDY